MVRKLWFGCLVVVAVPGVAAGQATQDQGGRINLVYIVTPKPGMTKQLEDGFKRHAAWHARQRDTRTITVATVAFGDGMGQYRVVYPNLRWEDMDAAAPLNAGDGADVQLNLAPYVESVESRILNRSDTLSRIPATEPAKAMNWVTYNFLHPGKGPEYFDYLAKLKQALGRANSSYRYFVLTQINGADSPAFVVVRPLDKWVENTNPQTRQALVAAYGELEADRLLNVQDVSVRRVVSFVATNRPDLGYTPGAR